MSPVTDAVAQAKGILGQLRSLASQHEDVLAAYERQLEAMVAAGPSKISSKSGPNKRPAAPAPPPEGPEAKRQRILAEQAQRREKVWAECSKLLERCRRNQKAEVFKRPVDYVRLRIPDYPIVVKQPMDLQTCGEKLKSRAYRDPGEFAADVRLIWSNAVAYNGPHHPVGQSANAMSDYFEKAWAPLQLEKAWAIHMQQEELAAAALRGDNLDSMPSLDLPKQLKDKREMLGHYIAAHDYLLKVPPGALGPCEPSREMGFEERRKLSALLTNLPGDKLQAVMDVVEAAAPVRER